MPNSTSFNWNDLRYFLEVARAGRLTEAARRLRQDHTTVSRRLAALEAAFGAQLFDRGPEGYRLTKSGQQLLKTAELIENTAISIKSDLKIDPDLIEGKVTIGSPSSFGGYFLAESLASLANENPGIEIELLAYSKIFNMMRRDADLVVSFSCPTEGRLFVRKLCDFSLHIYAAPSLLSKHASVRSRDDLQKMDFISYSDVDLYRSDLDYPRQIDPNIVPKFLVSNVTAQLHATIAGNGLCVLPDFVAAHAPALVKVFPEICFVRSLWLVSHADQHDLPHIRAVSEFITREVRKRRQSLCPADVPAIQRRAS